MSGLVANGTRLDVNRDGSHCYDIVYSDSFDALGGELVRLGCADRKVCVITDSNVEPIYGEELLCVVRSVSSHADIYTVQAGEEYKNLNSIYEIYRFLIENHYDRKSLLIALGGGVIGDMTGFAAATFLRGIDFIQIPTTLLAQADSSIGGKTGVDFEGYKNMVGAFYMPKLVYANASVLTTLSDLQFTSGFAEVMKHGLLLDNIYYDWLIAHADEIMARDISVLQTMLFRSNEIKKYVVEKDPYEKNIRMYLNLGHTLGHAIEKNSDFALAHGHCVAIGCIAAAYMSMNRSMIGADAYEKICRGFEMFDLSVPKVLNKVQDPETILRLTKSDKKMQNGQIRFVLLNDIGEAVVDNSVTDSEILSAVSELNRFLSINTSEKGDNE